MLIRYYLTYTYLKTQTTALSGISELLPGDLLNVRSNRIAITQDWSPWEFVRSDIRYLDRNEAETVVRHAVESTIRAWADSDESILLEASGGLDSSIVAGCLRGVSSRVSCCSLFTPLPGADERRYVIPVADHLNMPLYAEELSFDAARFAFPPPEHLAVPAINAMQHAIDTTIGAVADRTNSGSLYSGGGGDTVFGSLSGTSPAVDALKARGAAACALAVRDLSQVHRCTQWKVVHLAARKWIRRQGVLYKGLNWFQNPETTPDEFEEHPWLRGPADALPGDLERIIGLVGTQCFRDGAPRGDTRHLRLPLLSQPVVETCLRIPSWMWIRGGINRAIARSAFSDLLPSIVANRRSKGDFSQYMGGIYQRNRSAMLDYLLTGRLQDQGLLDTRSIRTFDESPQRPRDDTFMRVLDLCMIENWARHQS